jgi:hypothetical protein
MNEEYGPELGAMELPEGIRKRLRALDVIEVADLNPGRPGDPDYIARFPSLTFTIRLPLTLPEAMQHLQTVFGDWAAFFSSSQPFSLTEFQREAASGKWAIFREAPMVEYTRFGFLSAQAPGFLVAGTMPRSLMSDEESDWWWEQLVRGLEAVSERVKTGVIPPRRREVEFLPEAPPAPEPTGVRFRPLRDVLAEVASKHPDAILQYLQELGPDLAALDLIRMVEGDLAAAPESPQMRRIMEPNYYWGYDSEGRIQIVERPATRLFQQRVTS